MKKRILFNSQFLWTCSIVELGLAKALQLRGHDVCILTCGGLSRYCELITETQRRPSCESCLNNLKKPCEDLGLVYTKVSDYILAEDIMIANKISREGNIEELLKYKINNVNVGRLAWFNLFQYYHGYTSEIKGKRASVFRRCLHSAILLSFAMPRIFDSYNPDIAVSVNGKFIQWNPFIETAIKNNVDYVTWEDLFGVPGAVIFDRNAIAHEQKADKIWDRVKEEKLTNFQKQRLEKHFSFWKKGVTIPVPYYDNPEACNQTEFKQRIKLVDNKKIVSLFPNICWDSTSIGFDTAFLDMFDWLFKTIEYAQTNQEIQFVIRAHPGEKKVPVSFHSTSPVCDVIRYKYSNLPDNVFLIEPEDEITSYDLAEISDVVVVYTTTFGIELALMGIRPWVVADAYYSNKGFTTDIASLEEMSVLLDAQSFNQKLSENEISVAQRFAYLSRFERVFSFPLLNKDSLLDTRIIDSFVDGTNNTINNLCDFVLNGGVPFNLGPKKEMISEAFLNGEVLDPDDSSGKYFLEFKNIFNDYSEEVISKVTNYLKLRSNELMSEEEEKFFKEGEIFFRKIFF